MMTPTNRKSPGARGISEPFNWQAEHASQFKPMAAQLKNGVSAQSVKSPVAPPVYHPQVTPNAAQPKMANGAVNRKSPVAPPVYRPQQVPKVLQTKTASAQSLQVGHPPRRPVAPPAYRPEARKTIQPKALSQFRESPTATPVYRPEQKRVAQPKIASATPAQMLPKAPQVYRQQAKFPGVQAKMAGPSQLKNHPVAPPVYQPQTVPKVLQTKKTVTQQGGPRPQKYNRVATPGSMSGAIQRRLDSNARRIGNVIQRDVDVAAALKTENAQYLIDPGDTSVLYSEVNAPEPKPSWLYKRSIDRTKDKPRRHLFAWIPNVRFLSKSEQSASPSKSEPGSYEYTSKGSYFDSTSRFSLRELGREIEGTPIDGRPPLIGALGKNDCYAWADTLQNMIFTEALATNQYIPADRAKKNVNVTNPESPADLRVEVGDMMRHLYKNAVCKYHAATVVAKDGRSLVTLEGHVSKDIKKPEFHIRGGVLDFADEAIRKGHGDEVEITPLESLNSEMVAYERQGSGTRYDRMTSADIDDPGAVALALQTAGSNIGITITREMRRKIRAEERRKAQFNHIYEVDRRIHEENQARVLRGLRPIPLELTSFPSIED